MNSYQGGNRNNYNNRNTSGGGGGNYNNRFNNNNNNNSSFNNNRSGIGAALNDVATNDGNRDKPSFNDNKPSFNDNKPNPNYRGNNTGFNKPPYNQDNANSGFVKKFDGDFKQRKQVIQIINEVPLSENFTSSSALLVSTGQNQQAQMQLNQPQQNFADRLLISMCNQNLFQIHVAEKTDVSMKLVSSDCIASQSNVIKINNCFAVKNIQNDGLDMTVLTLRNTQNNLYGFTLIKTHPQTPNQLQSNMHVLIAHSDVITSVVTLDNWIVTVSDDNDKNYTKFWAIQQNNIALAQEITSIFNSSLKEAMTGINLELSPIQCIDFIMGGGKIYVVLSFVRQNQNQQNSNKIFPTQNSLYLFEFDQQSAQKGLKYKQKIDVGPVTAKIEKIKIIQNPMTQSVNIFAMESNFVPRDQNNPTTVRPARGFLYVVKNFSDCQELYTSNFNGSDFVISCAKTSATIVFATSQSIVPFTWNMTNDTYKKNQYDQNTFQQQGDIQRIHLFKNICNLVEINQLLTVHYPNEKGSTNPKKCITLSSLQLLDHYEKPRYDNTNSNDNEDTPAGNTNTFNNSSTNPRYNNNNNSRGGWNNNYRNNYNKTPF